MAKIRSFDEVIAGKKVVLTLTYSSKKKFGISGVPEDLFYVLGVEPIENFASETGVINHLTDLIAQYHKQIEVEEKVICYNLIGSKSQVSVPGRFHGWQSERREGVPSNVRSFMIMADDATTVLGLNYKVFRKVGLGEKITWVELDDKGTHVKTHTSSPGTELPWSEDLEAYFCKLKESINYQLMALGEFLLSGFDPGKVSTNLYLHHVIKTETDDDAIGESSANTRVFS